MVAMQFLYGSLLDLFPSVAVSFRIQAQSTYFYQSLYYQSKLQEKITD